MIVPPSTATATRSTVLGLYRALVRAARAFPEPSMGRKLLANARELTRLRRHETSPPRIAAHVADGRLALRVHALLARDPRLLAAITRKRSPPHVAAE